MQVHEHLSTACKSTVNFAMSSNSTQHAISAALYAGFCGVFGRPFTFPIVLASFESDPMRFGSTDPNLSNSVLGSLSDPYQGWVSRPKPNPYHGLGMVWGAHPGTRFGSVDPNSPSCTQWRCA